MEQLYLYVALVGIGLVLFALTRTRTKQEAAAPVAVSPQPAAPSSVDHELKEALEAFMNELEQDNARLLDSFGKLQTEYKRTIAEQQAVIRQLEARLATLEERSDTFWEAASAMRPEVEEEMTIVLAAEEAEALNEQPATPAFAFNEKYARVVELSRQGHSPEQIARDTGVGLGEIHLVLGLAKREEN